MSNTTQYIEVLSHPVELLMRTYRTSQNLINMSAEGRSQTLLELSDSLEAIDSVGVVLIIGRDIHITIKHDCEIDQAAPDAIKTSWESIDPAVIEVIKEHFGWSGQDIETRRSDAPIFFLQDG